MFVLWQWQQLDPFHYLGISSLREGRRKKKVWLSFFFIFFFFLPACSEFSFFLIAVCHGVKRQITKTVIQQRRDPAHVSQQSSTRRSTRFLEAVRTRSVLFRCLPASQPLRVFDQVIVVWLTVFVLCKWCCEFIVTLLAAQERMTPFSLKSDTVYTMEANCDCQTNRALIAAMRLFWDAVHLHF